MRAPVHGPAEWRGEALFRRDDWRHELTGDDVAELEAALAKSKRNGQPLEAIAVEAFPLPRLGPRLQAIQRSLELGSGAALLRGLPASRYSEEDAKRLFWGIGCHIGVAVSQSAKGERIFSVRDEGYRVGRDRQARGPNTNKGLSFHTDRCDVIAFLCLRQARSGGENFLASSMAIHNEILKQRPDLLAALYQPYYYQRHTVDEGNRQPYITQPVFAVHEGHFVANVLRVLIDRAQKDPQIPNLSAVQLEALDFLGTIAGDPAIHVGFRQEPGDMLFVNNFTVLHSRSAFEDHADRSRRRHLLRLWLSVPNSRPLPPSFSGNYGNTAAGAIRGGMKPLCSGANG